MEVAGDFGSCHDHPTAAETEGGSHTKVGNDDVAAAKSRSSSPTAASKPDTWELKIQALTLCVLLVVAVPVVVWRSIGQPPEHVVGRLSLLMCGCSIVWSRLLHAAMGVQITALFFSSGFVLALYADARMGALIAHLNSYIAAGMLGYALAERRQRDGAEVAAATAAAGNPSDEKEANRILCFQMLGGLCIALFTLEALAWVAWVVWHRADYPTQHLIADVFLPLSAALMFWSLFVAGMLLLGALTEDTWFWLLVMYMFSLVLLYILIFVLIGDIGAMVFCSLGDLGFPRFFGYTLSVYASFKLRLKLGQLPMKLGQGSKDSPRPSSATPSSPPEKGGLLFDPDMQSNKGSPF